MKKIIFIYFRSTLFCYIFTHYFKQNCSVFFFKQQVYNKALIKFKKKQQSFRDRNRKVNNSSRHGVLLLCKYTHIMKIWGKDDFNRKIYTSIVKINDVQLTYLKKKLLNRNSNIASFFKSGSFFLCSPLSSNFQCFSLIFDIHQWWMSLPKFFKMNYFSCDRNKRPFFIFSNCLIRKKTGVC